jgi:8-oxo-dGTP pyrophosphatase MutT (NUDIX family)
MINWVNGFMFSPDLKRVALIRKRRKPGLESLANKLNGIGGEIEFGETPLQAQRREFREETGFASSNWEKFCELTIKGKGVVHFFVSIGDVDQLQTTTVEEVVIIKVESIPMRDDIVENVKWLVPLALDRNNWYVDASYQSRNQIPYAV